MRRKYKVLWAEVAEKDLSRIIERIAEENPINAKKVFKRIKDKTSNLYLFPERGRVVPELLEQGISKYRELAIPPWRILYRVSSKRVCVLSVLDSRRNVEDILLNRIIEI